ncbi:hypothetical protein CEXT_12031 [Caerostris extrusa]|uniref:Uncharacterized protein n=1 Tax=Caerostris extrusa TaxID=172846 RepID=A0AAV4Y8W0_CAEEX|nr:hypothetical protein CEXT_12031 [Caerostris extrusa]
MKNAWRHFRYHASDGKNTKCAIFERRHFSIYGSRTGFCPFRNSTPVSTKREKDRGLELAFARSEILLLQAQKQRELFMDFVCELGERLLSLLRMRSKVQFSFIKSKQALGE